MHKGYLVIWAWIAHTKKKVQLWVCISVFSLVPEAIS